MKIEKCCRCIGSPACENQVVEKCLPVPTFGNLTHKNLRVVTVGLNPALNEFLNFNGQENTRSQRLALTTDYNSSRSDLSDTNVNDAISRRESYFTDLERGWHGYFEKLDGLLCRVNPDWSYATGSAAHIDLVACATSVAFGKLSQICQSELLRNCRDHFLASLSCVPSGTLLLFDGATVTKEIYASGLEVKQQGGTQLINTKGDQGRIGKLTFGVKEFSFRAWSTPAGRLPAIWRYDLAFWLFGTLCSGKWFGRGIKLNES
jgi:hypothetical protein